MHTTVCFVNNEIQSVFLLTGSVFDGFPDSILPGIRMMAQISGFSQLLSVEKIDMPIFQNFLVKRLIGYYDALIKTDPVRLLIDFLPGLLIQLRRIRQPYEDGFRLFCIIFRSEVDVLDERRHDNCLSGSSRGLK